MKLLEKILLATDFSKASASAVQLALSLAKKLKSKIILIHVIPDNHAFTLAQDMVRSTAERFLGEISEQIMDSGVTLVDSILTTGTPFDRINYHARMKDVNLIVMGSGNQEIDHCFPLGMTAQKVLAKSEKPVLIARRDSSVNIKRILCPVDCSDPSKLALSSAIHVAHALKAELTVMTAIEPPPRYHTEAKETYLQRQRTQFENFLTEFDLSIVNWSKEIREGIAYREIIHAIAANNIDLLVMGSTGKTGLARILLGSVTEKVIREVPCSLLVEKSEDVIRLRVDQEIEDLEAHLLEGNSLLENGFYREARQQFQFCLNIDRLFIPAWEAIAIAHERLGDVADADVSRQRAAEIREKLWERQVEAEIRSKHSLFGKKDKPV